MKVATTIDAADVESLRLHNGGAEGPADQSQDRENTLIVSTDSRPSSGAEQPTDNPPDAEGKQASTEYNGCRAAKQILNNPLLMNIFEIQEWHTIAECAIVNNFWKQTADEWRKELHEISRFNCEPINDMVLNLAARSCPNLHTLDLRNSLGKGTIAGSSCTAGALRAVARGCRGLRRVNFGTGFRNPGGFRFASDIDVVPFVENCRRLSHLDLTFSLIGDNVLRRVAENCSEIQILMLKTTAITSHGIIMVANRCLKLESLSIAETECDERSLQVDFPELTHLNVCGCEEMDHDDAFAAAMRCCPKLQQMAGPDPGRIWTRSRE